MKKVSLPLILFGLILAFPAYTTSAHAQATRTWVSGVGDDVNPCSRTAPCKTFAGAISKTAAGGEIDCLDPGGFGGVTITKSMTIDCGTNAGGILNSGQNAVVINAGVSDKVVLRNLVIQGTVGVTQGVNGIRWLAGSELHLDRVVVQGQSTLCVDVAKSAGGTLYVKDSYFTECPTGIKMTTSSGFLLASIDRSYFHGLAANGVTTGNNVLANVSNSTFENIPGIAMSASASGAFISANNNTLGNNGTGFSAVAGANLRLSNNDLYDNSTGISNAGNFLSNGLNRVSGGTPGATQTGPIPLR